jgi:hypothetical protein
MSVVAAALRELMALGVAGDALVAAIERIEEAATIERTASVLEAVSLASEKADRDLADRKARAAERTRKWREKANKPGCDVTERHRDACEASPPPPPAFPPEPPQPPTPTRESVTSREGREREEAAFGRFWLAYPRKTAKADARKAFTKAWRKLAKEPDAEQVLAGGLERAKAAWVDAQFIPHPATWLNGERWTDEPNVIPLNPRQAHDRPHHDQRQAARQDNLGRMLSGLMAAVDEREPDVGGRDP